MTDTDLEEPGAKASADEIEADLERTREQLGETIDALGAKFDVKTNAKNKMNGIKRRAENELRTARIHADQTAARVRSAATDENGKPKPAVLGGTAAVFIVLGIVVWRRMR